MFEAYGNDLISFSRLAKFKAWAIYTEEVLMLKTETGALLIVEDEIDLIDVLREELAQITPKIFVALNGAEALKILEKENVTAVLSDINMPKMNGLELLYEVRSRGWELPFVILTAFYDRENMLSALRLGATDFLEKPFRIKVMLDVMTKAQKLGLEVARIEREIEALCQDLKVPAEKRAWFKKAQLAVRMMNRELEIYGKKAA